MTSSGHEQAMQLLMGFQPLAHGTRDRTLVIERGKGVFVYDEAGKEYLEAASSFYVAGLGYSDDELIETAIEQLRKLPFYVSAQYRSVPTAIALAEKLADVLPVANAKIAFASTGSEANDFLMKFLRFRNQMGGREARTKVIARHGSYHGATLASASLTGGHHEEFGLPLPGFLHTEQPLRTAMKEGEDEGAFAERMADELEALILREDPETIGAFVSEPVSFSAGLVIPPADYWQRIQAVLVKYDICCFADEVVTGFCRTGHWFACETYGIKADAVTIGKGVTSGYFPMAAIAMSGEFYEDIERGSDKLNGFAHASTHAGHPVGAAMALKVLEIIERRRLLDHAREVGVYLQEKVATYAGHPLVANVRGVGLAAAVEFVSDKNAGASLEPSSVACAVFCEQAHKNGLLVRGTGSSALIAPPLVITRDEIDELFRRFDVALAESEARLRL